MILREAVPGASAAPSSDRPPSGTAPAPHSPGWRRVARRHGLPAPSVLIAQTVSGANAVGPRPTPAALRPEPLSPAPLDLQPAASRPVPHEARSAVPVSLPSSRSSALPEHSPAHRPLPAVDRVRNAPRSAGPALAAASGVLVSPAASPRSLGEEGPVRAPLSLAASPPGVGVRQIPVRRAGGMRRVQVARRLSERGQRPVRSSPGPGPAAGGELPRGGLGAGAVGIPGSEAHRVTALSSPAASVSPEAVAASEPMRTSQPTWTVQALAPPSAAGARFALRPPSHGQPVMVAWNAAGSGHVEIALPAAWAEVAPSLRAEAPGLLTALGQAGWTARHLTVSASRGGSSPATSSRTPGHKASGRRFFRSRQERRS